MLHMQHITWVKSQGLCHDSVCPLVSHLILWASANLLQVETHNTCHIGEQNENINMEVPEGKRRYRHQSCLPKGGILLSQYHQPGEWHFWKFFLGPKPTFILAMLTVVLASAHGDLNHLYTKVPKYVVWVGSSPIPGTSLLHRSWILSLLMRCSHVCRATVSPEIPHFL